MVQLNVLHISNGYAGSKVHCNLIKELDSIGISQTVYCPVRTREELGKNCFDSSKTFFKYSFCIRPWHKFVYHIKCHTLYKDLTRNIDLSKFHLIHATTLFSDGALAYKAYKEYGIPYVVAVRATDIYDFIGRKMYHTWTDGRNILLNAQKIYFISASGKNAFEHTCFAKPILSQIKHKFILRPNGVDQTFLDNIDVSSHNSKIVCYIGTFLRRKNLERVIEAISRLRQIDGYKDVTLRIIGGGDDRWNKIESLIQEHSDFIDFKGKISDKKLLITSMRECAMFAMPSFSETFGLVYIEALTQNLPIIYTKNDGVDGLFDKSAGIAVNPSSVQEIQDAIKKVFDNLGYFNNDNVDFNRFNWSRISDQYINDYNEIICR